MAKYIVATTEEIPPGERKIVNIAGRSIGIFNVNGEFFALRNSCPHQGAALCEGILSGFVSSPEPGKYVLDRQGEILRCPWHTWEFDIKTGQSWFDPSKTRVRSYPANIEQGCNLPAPCQPVKEAGLEKGPFIAESFPVSIDKQYVVLEV